MSRFNKFNVTLQKQCIYSFHVSTSLSVFNKSSKIHIYSTYMASMSIQAKLLIIQ